MSIKIEADIGYKNGRPLAPFVGIDYIDSDIGWMSPAQARKLAERLVKAAARAEVKYARHLAKTTKPKPVRISVDSAWTNEAFDGPQT